MNHNTHHSLVRLARHAPSLLVAGALTLTAVACSGVSAHGELGENQRLLKSCPDTAPATLVEVDATGSSATEEITAERLGAIEAITRQTAVCSGRLRVIVFAGSSADTAVLVDRELRPEGATDNARLRRVPALVDQVMAEIRSGYDQAVAGLAQTASDITAQLRLAAEWAGQLGDTGALNLFVLTDGFQTAGIDLGARSVSTEDAAELAEGVSVPDLSGAHVMIAGLGHVAGDPPPSTVIEGLVAFYDALCARTNATECESVTDYARVGR